jgi:hypothetical protein
LEWVGIGNGLTVGTRVGGAERPEISTAQTVFALVLSACVLACMLAYFHTLHGEAGPSGRRRLRSTAAAAGCWLLLAAGCLRGMHVAWRCADRSKQSLSRAHAKAKTKSQRQRRVPLCIPSCSHHESCRGPVPKRGGMGKQGLERRKGSSILLLITSSTTVNGPRSDSSDRSDRSDRDESGWGGSHTWKHVTSICSTRNEGLRAQTGSLVSGHGSMAAWQHGSMA